MSSSENGPPEGTVNSVFDLHFDKWKLCRTSEKEDTWRKRVIDITDSYIQIRRVNIDGLRREFEYHIYFAGATHKLREPFKKFHTEYVDHDSTLLFGEVQAAKDYIDRFIERLNNLKAFL